MSSSPAWRIPSPEYAPMLAPLLIQQLLATRVVAPYLGASRCHDDEEHTST